MVGFGFSERPKGVKYNVQTWADQTVGLMDALGIEKTSLVGNSFGGAIAFGSQPNIPTASTSWS